MTLYREESSDFWLFTIIEHIIYVNSVSGGSKHANKSIFQLQL